ncbi:MAG: hypothetical protein F6K54_23280 [Okeania sp. SIO3B5]|uniref:hypothetical protein n=1 Tax=Okeania sp. SIO3B5 TaxID=2607811 RepID=UPI0014019A19|nr:hypothetical protein [Okeania sp. SIO3B5]NEO55732.1 hypothetical protein [Okeania sp. SIO3B5]
MILLRGRKQSQRFLLVYILLHSEVYLCLLDCFILNVALENGVMGGWGDGGMG